MGIEDKLDKYVGEKEWRTYFDRDVCEGRTDEYDEVCPKKYKTAGIARCGCCGCTLKGLDLADSPPSDCPRLESHTE